MGVWGTGFFDNDEALDLCDTLGTHGIRRLRQVLRSVMSVPAAHLIDEDQAFQTVAAVAVLAYVSGLNVKGVPAEIRGLLDGGRVKCSPNDLLLAQDALQRVLHHSWLAQAWSSSDRKRWRQQVRRLLARLKSVTDSEAESLHRRDKASGTKKATTLKPKSIKPQAGDIILIPLSMDEYVVAKVLFASKIFKHCILLGVTDIVLRSLVMPASVPSQYILHIYATDQEFIEGIWHKVGNLPLSELEERASLRLVGDEVWLGDQLLRKASTQDSKTLPHMSPGGSVAVEYEIQCALGRLRSGSVQERAKVYHLRGLLYLQRNEPKKALEYLNQALNDDSQLAIAYWDRAKAWEALGKRERAEQDRAKALSIDPSLKR
ncbi:MAG: hypothetical protein KatS3mg112_1758 [Thermogutta sp.]|nr:MAG: hypothetical protein KatS3mg112_1758 [Thermogutta sp.]